MSAEHNSRMQLEDIEAIKTLKARYGYYCDDNYDPDGIASLFVENGVWDGGQFGRHEGRRAVHVVFHGLSRDKISFAMHLFMNPLIEVSGDSAVGHWYLLAPLTLREGDEAIWCAGRYFEEYVKVDDGWKYKLLRFTRILFPRSIRDGRRRNSFFRIASANHGCVIPVRTCPRRQRELSDD
jgi:hypothetical protein